MPDGMSDAMNKSPNTAESPAKPCWCSCRERTANRITVDKPRATIPHHTNAPPRATCLPRDTGSAGLMGGSHVQLASGSCAVTVATPQGCAMRTFRTTSSVGIEALSGSTLRRSDALPVPSVEALHLLLLAPSPRAHSTSVCRKPLGTGLDAPWGGAKCQWSSRSDCPSEFGQPLSPSALPYWPFRSCGPPTRFANTGPYQLDVRTNSEPPRWTPLSGVSDPLPRRLGAVSGPSRGRHWANSGPLGGSRVTGHRPGPPPAPRNTSNSLDTPSIVCRLSGAGKYGGRPMMIIKREGYSPGEGMRVATERRHVATGSSPAQCREERYLVR